MRRKMMLRIKLAPEDPQSMAQDGSSILRSLQNRSLPMVDLLVRESIQNSLDASIDRSANGFTYVDYHVGQFESQELSRWFEAVGPELARRFPRTQHYLSIEDSGTTGLTGSFTSEVPEVLNESNFHKLVFGIGKNQDVEGAGGSWGLGKTSYFRVGIGLVIYYTRIKRKSGYQERLIASLIEDNKQPYRLLTKSNRGIAWWGVESENGNRIYPIVDPETIQEFLSIFNLRRYSGDETGTSIIIPYLKKEFINHETSNDPIKEKCGWLNELSSEIEVAVQRWYYPRINNKSYSTHFKRAQLLCRVNDRPILKSTMLPVFRLMQDIYNSALIGNSVSEKIIVKPVAIHRKDLANTTEEIGYVAFIEASREELKMGPPNYYQSPLAYFGNYSKDKIESHNSRVLAFSRMPGMVVRYAIDESWVPTGPIQSEKHMLLGMFVPRSAVKLSPLYYEHDSLEEYLRASENADHADWVDGDKFTLVKRIIRNSRKAIQEYFETETSNNSFSATSRLAKKYGTLLMPPTGFGKGSSASKDRPSRPSGDRRNGPKHKATVSILGSKLVGEDQVEIEVEVAIPINKECRLKIAVVSQAGNLDYASWQKEITDVPFPFKFTKLRFQDGRNVAYNFAMNQTAVHFLAANKPQTYHMVLAMRKTSNKFMPNIIIESK